MSTINDIEKTARQLSEYLIGEDLILTGSYALYLMGLREESQVGDLDIIVVNPSNKAVELFEALMKDKPALTKPASGGRVSYIFELNGVKVDVFIRGASEIPEARLKKGPFLVASVRHIVKEKKRANRLKDWQTLSHMAKQITTDAEILNWINNK